MSSDLVTYELDGAVALVGLNRPKKRNAINNAVVVQLRDAVVRAGEEADAGVIFGHGVNFSAGLDLEELLKRMDPRHHGRARNPITPGTPCSTSSRAVRSPSSPRCTARSSAAAWSSRRRPISGSPTARHSSAFPKASAAFLSAAAARFAFSASSAIR